MKTGAIFKRFGTLLLSLAVLFSLVLPEAALAETTGDSVPAGSITQNNLTFPVHVIHKTGDDKENFVIVIMGDGYTKDRQEQFVQDATARAQHLLTYSPYREYSDRINIYAVKVISNESGMSDYFGKAADTYFHVAAAGTRVGFTQDGKERAEKLQEELEQNYLDEGASIGTIHILSNYGLSYGSSAGAMYSFSTAVDSDTTVHELSHSIGDLGDEYDRYTTKANVSDTTDPETIKWKKLLGFRGIGVTQAGTETAFAPGRKCMMRRQGEPFCEVCKLEIARHLNDADYVKTPKTLYVADPEISIPHSQTGTLDSDSEKYRITEKNITKANGTSLEFRTVVQSTINREQKLKLRFRILGANGETVKYEKEEEFTIPALSNWYRADDARVSLSLKFQSVNGLEAGDKPEGKAINAETDEVLATDKTAEQSRSAVKLHYILKNNTAEAVPQTTTATVYVPKDSVYTLRYPQLSGYTCTGSSESSDTVRITEADRDITYYYQASSNSAERPTTNLEIKAKKNGTAEVQARIDGANTIPSGCFKLYVDGLFTERKQIDEAGKANFTVAQLSTGLHTAYVKFTPADRNENVLAVTGQGKKFVVPEQDSVDCTSAPVYADYDGSPHTFDIRCGEGVSISYGTTEGIYDRTEMPKYVDAGEYKLYFKATEGNLSYEGTADCQGSCQ